MGVLAEVVAQGEVTLVTGTSGRGVLSRGGKGPDLGTTGRVQRGHLGWEHLKVGCAVRGCQSGIGQECFLGEGPENMLSRRQE